MDEERVKQRFYDVLQGGDSATSLINIDDTNSSKKDGEEEDGETQVLVAAAAEPVSCKTNNTDDNVVDTQRIQTTNTPSPSRNRKESRDNPLDRRSLPSCSSSSSAEEAVLTASSIVLNNSLKCNKRKVFNRKQLQSIIENIKRVTREMVGNSRKRSGKAKTPHLYYLLKKYKVVENELVDIKTGRKYVALEDLFMIIRNSHIACGHGGELRTLHQLKEVDRIYNITYHHVRIYISLCEKCLLKQNKVKKSNIQIKPIISSTFAERYQADLIDLSNHKSNISFRYILNVQDHMTKFCILRAIPNKNATTILSALIDIFSTFGPPKIFQTDNGHEFSSKTVKDGLKEYWPSLQILHGRPRHPQSQGSIERSNADILKILKCWLMDHHDTDWVRGLPHVQLQKNTSYNRSIKCSPYFAVFGQNPHFNYQDCSNSANRNDDDDDDNNGDGNGDGNDDIGGDDKDEDGDNDNNNHDDGDYYYFPRQEENETATTKSAAATTRKVAIGNGTNNCNIIIDDCNNDDDDYGNVTININLDDASNDNNHQDDDDGNVTVIYIDENDYDNVVYRQHITDTAATSLLPPLPPPLPLITMMNSSSSTTTTTTSTIMPASAPVTMTITTTPTPPATTTCIMTTATTTTTTSPVRMTITTNTTTTMPVVKTTTTTATTTTATSGDYGCSTHPTIPPTSTTTPFTAASHKLINVRRRVKDELKVSADKMIKRGMKKCSSIPTIIPIGSYVTVNLPKIDVCHKLVFSNILCKVIKYYPEIDKYRVKTTIDNLVIKDYLSYEQIKICKNINKNCFHHHPTEEIETSGRKRSLNPSPVVSQDAKKKLRGRYNTRSSTKYLPNNMNPVVVLEKLKSFSSPSPAVVATAFSSSASTVVDTSPSTSTSNSSTSVAVNVNRAIPSFHPSSSMSSSSPSSSAQQQPPPPLLQLRSRHDQEGGLLPPPPTSPQLGTKMYSLRTISQIHGQKFVKCLCIGKCNTKKCKCIKNKNKCIDMLCHRGRTNTRCLNI